MSNLWTTLDAWGEIWMANLWRAAWQGAIAVLAAWAIVRWCRFLSPRVTCWIWRLVCIKFLMTLLWTQPIALPVLPPERVAPLNAAPVSTTSRVAAIASTEAADFPAPERHRVRRAITQQGPTVAGSLAVAWIVGICTAVALTARQWFVLRCLVRAADAPSTPAIAQALRDEACRLGVKRLPRLLVSPQLHSPLLAGVWTPAIVLPASAETSADEAELRIMLAHELGHQRRHDLAWNWLPTAVGWIFFFHPLLWALRRKWCEAQEAACDELLIQQRAVAPIDYGRLLLKIATRHAPERHPTLITAGVLGAYRDLENRIVAMSRVRDYSPRRLMTVGSSLAIVGLLGVVPWQLVAQEPTAQKPAAPKNTGTYRWQLQKLPGSIYTCAAWEVEAAEGKTESRRGLIAIDPNTGTFQTIGVDGFSARVSPVDQRFLIQQWSKDVPEKPFSVADLHVADLGNPQPREIARHSIRPVWSPDGKRALYNVANDKAGKPGDANDVGFRGAAWTVDVETRQTKELGVPETDEVDDWTGHGDWLVTVSDRHEPFGSGYQLYVMHPDGSEQRRLTVGKGLNCYPRFSPDGKHLVYNHQARGVNSLWLVDIDGKNPRQIMVEDGAKAMPDGACWAPDGKWLAVRLEDWQINEKGEKFSGDLKLANHRIAIVAPDGTKHGEIAIQGIKQMIFLGDLDWR